MCNTKAFSELSLDETINVNGGIGDIALLLIALGTAGVVGMAKNTKTPDYSNGHFIPNPNGSYPAAIWVPN